MVTPRRLALAALYAGFGLPPVLAAEPLNPVAQRDQQKKVQADVEQTARRIATTLRVMTYQKLDGGTEQKMLEDVAGTLRGLSAGQIQSVLKHLDAAAAAPNEDAATAEQKSARTKHREVLTSLRGMLTKLDVIKSLDVAAARLDKLAKDQHALHLRSLASEAAKSREQYDRRGRRMTSDDREEQADGQVDLKNDLVSMKVQLASLRGTLNPEQKDRLDKSDVEGKGGRLVGDMVSSAQNVASGNFPEAADRQLRNSRDLQALAASLRAPRDKVTALREARDRIEKLIEAEKALKAESELMKSTKDLPRDRRQTDPAAVHAQQMADKQAKLEFETRDVRKGLDEIAREAAAKLTPAESEMKRAQEFLRDLEPARAVEPEENATDRLTEARDELDKQLAKAEKQKADPLTATKKAAELVEKLIQEQKAAKEVTKPETVKQAEKAQVEVAKKADDLKNLPLPDAPEAKDALKKAADAAKDAAKDIQNQEPDSAKPKQDETVRQLEAAKKALDEKAKEIEKRREDIAKLDEAKKKLDELAKQEQKVADGAKEQAKAEKPETADLAKKQGELNPEAKKIGDEVKDAAPEAAQKVAEAGEKMEAAKKDLDAKQADPGAKDAADAAKKLAEAGEALQKKADELKAKELADQAALKPNQVNPQDAAQQLAKAVEQANKAADEANKAAAQQKDAAQDLAKAQQQLAERAEAMKQPDAAKDAGDAAKSLEKGDLPQAIQQQKAAQEKLDAAQKGQPMPGEKGSPMPGEKGEPKPGDLGGEQQKLREATEALQKSMDANQAAQAALAQAQALAPQGVQPQLQDAQKQLQQAQQQLNQQKPAEAGQNQQQAAQKLNEALQQLNAAAQKMGQPGQQPGEPQSAQPGQQPGDGPPMPGEGQQPGQQPGQKPGQKPGQGKPGEKGQQPGQKPGDQPGEKGQNDDEKNGTPGNGDREGTSKNKERGVAGKAGEGDGSFIHLRKQERDKVQQNAEAAFPAEFRELIKQYNINIKGAGKAQMPAAKPAEKK